MSDYTVKEMKPVEVRCEKGLVSLTQLDPMGNDDAVIVLAPEQVPLVAKWMQEAAFAAAREGA
jgi:hypothetical protein